MLAPRMPDVRLHTPAPPLSAFVELVWLCRRDAEPWAQERLLPQGSVELVLDLAARPGDDVISGPHSRYFVIDTDRPQDLVGVHFGPGGAFPFIGPPMHELRNAIAPLDAFWGNLARELRERLGEAQSDDDRFRIVESALLARAGRRLQRHPAVGYALGAFMRVPHVRTVAEVSGRVGLSQRRFIELFANEVGLTPKVFCRVRRFQEAIGRAHSSTFQVPGSRRVNWSELALDCGYFDQAHFIHDFEAFSGLTPSAWLAQRTDHVNHVPLRD